ncbi:MAG: glycogen debranching enzyme, partial [Chthoniobacter sp. 12-60-6]
GNDGDNSNHSWNCGAEGPADDPAVNALRRRQKRNFLSTLFLSLGVPMLCGGDEYGRTQQGNNNAYCQDNEISWFKWERTKEEVTQMEFTARLIAFRRHHPIFRRPKFFYGRKVRGADVKDIMWLNPGGQEMNDDEWNTSYVRTLGVLVCGDSHDVLDWHGTPVHDDTFLMLLNASHQQVDFTLPNHAATRWEVLLDTTQESGFLEVPSEHSAGEKLPLPERCFVLLRRMS